VNHLQSEDRMGPRRKALKRSPSLIAESPVSDAALDAVVGGGGAPRRPDVDPWSQPLMDHDLPVVAHEAENPPENAPARKVGP
jgi:hypothetical protein